MGQLAFAQANSEVHCHFFMAVYCVQCCLSDFRICLDISICFCREQQAAMLRTSPQGARSKSIHFQAAHVPGRNPSLST